MGFGMSFQFGMHFLKFLKRKKRMKKLLYIVIALLVTSIVYKHIPQEPIENGFNIQGFAELPVQVGGRIKLP